MTKQDERNQNDKLKPSKSDVPIKQKSLNETKERKGI